MAQITDKLFCPMLPEQEKGYTQACAERTLRYDSLFLAFIIIIQLYNLAYALLYTHGRLYTTASRVYAALYTALLLVSAAALLLKRRLKKNMPQRAAAVVRLQVSYCLLLIAWSACVTIYDQRVSDSISVCLTVSLSVAMLAHFTPVQAVAAYGSLLAALHWLLPLFRQKQASNYGNYINLAVMALISIVLCIYRYSSGRRRYLDQQIILTQNCRLAEAATHDPLTTLRNRRFLDEEMDRLYQACAAAGTPMTVMMIDIDRFKRYNDTYGHPQGDECLRRMTWRLVQELDDTREYLIRYGGEEFLYVGLGLDRQAAAEKGQHFNDVIRSLVIGPSERDPRGITISIGVYCGQPTGDQPWKDFISKADQALYQAKNSGRDRCIVA